MYKVTGRSICPERFRLTEVYPRTIDPETQGEIDSLLPEASHYLFYYTIMLRGQSHSKQKLFFFNLKLIRFTMDLITKKRRFLNIVAFFLNFAIHPYS